MKLSRHVVLVAFIVFVCALFAGCSKDVTIGAVVSETGAIAPYGESVRRGIDLAVEELNAAGGVGGGIISVVYKDDASNPETGKAALNELDDAGVKLVVGGLSSDVMLAIAPIAEQNKMVLLSPSASAPAVTDAGDYIFRNYPSDILEGTAMADFARSVGLKTVVIFALNNEYGAGLREIFTKRFESKSRSVAETFLVGENDLGDVDAMMTRTKELKPDGVYLITYVDQKVELLKQLEKAGIESVLMGTSSYTSKVAADAGDAAENLVYPQPVFDIESQDEAVAAFVRTYQEKYAALPDIYAAHGYDALKLMAVAIVRGESSHPDDVMGGLMGLESWQGAAGLTQFDKNGDVVRRPRMFIVRAGQPLLWDIFEEQGGELPSLVR